MKLVSILLLTAFLTGCSLFECREQPPQVIIPPNTCFDPPNAHVVIMRDVAFNVTKDEFGIYWISVNPKDYENLALNMSEIKQHLKEKNAIIYYFKECNKDANRTETE